MHNGLSNHSHDKKGEDSRIYRIKALLNPIELIYQSHSVFRFFLPSPQTSPPSTSSGSAGEGVVAIPYPFWGEGQGEGSGYV
jgi:hypothetical protein